MYMDKVKNFCDHSIILWEMAGNLLTDGWIPPHPMYFRVNSPSINDSGLKILIYNTTGQTCKFWAIRLVIDKSGSGHLQRSGTTNPSCHSDSKFLGHYQLTSLWTDIFTNRCRYRLTLLRIDQNSRSKNSSTADDLLFSYLLSFACSAQQYQLSCSARVLEW